MGKSVAFITLFLFIIVTNIARAAPPSQAEDGQVYIVQTGDWLSKLADKFYGDPLSWAIIQQATNAKALEDKSFTFVTDPNLLSVGQKLWIPKVNSSTLENQQASSIPHPDQLPIPFREDCSLFGYVNTSGDWITDPQFDGVAYVFYEGMATVRRDHKYGFVDQNGQIAIEPQFDYAQNFSEGLVAIVIDKKYGYADKSGRVVIKPQFERANDFSNGFALVVIDNQYRYINQMGEIVVKLSQVDEVYDFKDGLARVKLNSKYGYINKTGQTVIEAQFDDAGDFSASLAAVKVNNQWGYIDQNGQIVIEPQFSSAENFSDGLARVWLKGKRGYIDQTGKMVIDASQFIEVNKFTEGLAKVWTMKHGNGYYGYMDTTGQIVIQPQFLLSWPFINGRAYASDSSSWGFIDKTGHWVFKTPCKVCGGCGGLFTW